MKIENFISMELKIENFISNSFLEFFYIILSGKDAPNTTLYHLHLVVVWKAIVAYVPGVLLIDILFSSCK